MIIILLHRYCMVIIMNEPSLLTMVTEWMNEIIGFGGIQAILMNKLSRKTDDNDHEPFPLIPLLICFFLRNLNSCFFFSFLFFFWFVKSYLPVLSKNNTIYQSVLMRFQSINQENIIKRSGQTTRPLQYSGQ
jgi:hypothetical protein